MALTILWILESKDEKGERASSGKIVGKSIFKVSSFSPYKEASVQGLKTLGNESTEARNASMSRE